MKNKPIKNTFYCAPGQKIPPAILQELEKINDHFTKSHDFAKYKQDIANLFKLKPNNITNEQKFFFGGFLEGEGSLNLSAKKLKTAKFGMLIDPEFNITQHANGANQLLVALSILQTGRIRHKSGSNATLVLTIDNRKSLEEKVIPFYEEYVAPFSSEQKLKRLKTFKKLLQIFDEKGHQDEKRFINEILPLWDDLRMQKGQKNESFTSLKDAQDFVRDHIEKKKSD